MLKAEARWIEDALGEVTAPSTTLLNVGSSTRSLREEVQPWIDAHVFAPLRRRGVRVLHQDLAQADGVDVVGDLLDPSVQRALIDLGASTVLCSSMLEHVPDRPAMAHAIAGLVPPGGHLIVTVPRAFPYHPDPIDTMYRPTPGELRSLFGDLEVRREIDLACGTMLELMAANPAHLARRLLRIVSGGVIPVGASGGSSVRDFAPWLLRELRVSCVLLQRPQTDTGARSPR